MPELPEVETVRKQLESMVLGKTFRSVDVLWENIIAEPTVGAFKKELVGQTIHEVKRLGKQLFFMLDHQVLIVHLRMEGKFFIKENEKVSKHEHVIFHMEDGSTIRYQDVRKFGKMHLLDKDNYQSLPPISHLGYEPFDQACDQDYLFHRLSGKRIPIKTALLDQSIIAGLGNIYVNEVLFKCGIHPNRPANEISLEKCGEIIAVSIDVLNRAIELGGTTIHSYHAVDGVNGLFQIELLVHGKVSLPCPVCHQPIEKIKVGGRGTYFCSHCQK